MKIDDYFKLLRESNFKVPPFDDTVDAFEKTIIKAALKLKGWNIAETAKFLRLKRTTLQQKIYKAKIDVRQERHTVDNS